MKRFVCLLLLGFPLLCEARGGHCHGGHSSHVGHSSSFRRSSPFLGTSSFFRGRSSFFGGLFYQAPLQPLQYKGQSAVDLLEMDGSYTRDSLVKGLALALAPKGNRMLPCVLDFDEVMRDGGYARFLADWEPGARAELLGYLQQLECEDSLRITQGIMATSNPSQEELTLATQELLDDGNSLSDALWDYCTDHREVVAGP